MSNIDPLEEEYYSTHPTSLTGLTPPPKDEHKISYTLGELFALEIEQDPKLVDPIFPAIGLAGIVGRPDSGKSMLARYLAIHVALGMTEFLDMPLKLRHGKAIYVATEDSLESSKFVLGKQYHTLKEEYKKNTLSLPGNHSRKNGSPSENLEIIFAESLTGEELLEELTLSLKHQRADLIVIDSFGDVFSGKDGNSNADVRKALKPFYSLATEFKCLILFVTHINKSGYNASPDQAHVQGASAFAQKVRTIVDLRSDMNDPDYKLLTVTKGNGVSSEFKKQAMRLVFDRDQFVYEDTGHRIPLAQIVTSALKPPLEIDWDLIFGDDPSLSTADIVARVKDIYPLKERQIRKYVYDQLASVSYGRYAPASKLVPSPVVDMELV